MEPEPKPKRPKEVVIVIDEPYTGRAHVEVIEDEDEPSGPPGPVPRASDG